MSDQRVLIVDDEPDMVENCALASWRGRGYQCLTTTDPEKRWASWSPSTPTS